MKKWIGRIVMVVVFAGLAGVGWWAYRPFVAGDPHAGHEMAGPAATQPASRPAEGEGYWTCAMHPQVRADEPGPCPVCGMDLHWRSADEADPNVIRVDSGVRAAIGLVTVPAEVRALGREVRTVGRVEADERRLHHVHTKVEGWIERLHVDFVGAEVGAGDPLLTIYSPELLATEEEYLIALAAERELASSTDADARLRGVNLRSIAERRLRLFDVPEGEIARLEMTGEPSRTVTLTSPASGYVTALEVRHGMAVGPMMNLMTIADLSSIWVIADLYEDEMAGVKEGLAATATFRQLPGRTFRGTVEYVYPTLDGATRTNRARIAFRNPDLALKPGMFGDVTIAAPGERAVSIPVDAVIRTGSRDIVFVETSPGAFEVREVTLGPQYGDRYAVREGLRAGEKVVARANYFLDSEASIRQAVLSGGGAGGHVH